MNVSQGSWSNQPMEWPLKDTFQSRLEIINFPWFFFLCSKKVHSPFPVVIPFSFLFFLRLFVFDFARTRNYLGNCFGWWKVILVGWGLFWSAEGWFGWLGIVLVGWRLFRLVVGCFDWTKVALVGWGLFWLVEGCFGWLWVIWLTEWFVLQSMHRMSLICFVSLPCSHHTPLSKHPKKCNKYRWPSEILGWLFLFVFLFFDLTAPAQMLLGHQIRTLPSRTRLG